MKVKLLLIAFICLLSNELQAQPSIEWQYSFGGTDIDGMESLNGGRDHLQQTQDGGFIIAASSNSNNGDVTGHNGSSATSDFWVVKIDSLGSIEWGDSYGGTQNETVRSIKTTADGGYFLTGTTNSPDGDVTGWHGQNPATTDVWVVKLDAMGNIEWEHAFGGSEDERGDSGMETSDGGFVFVGFTNNSTDGDVSGAHGGMDAWMVKLNSAGSLQWQKCFGGSSDDLLTSVRQTTDGGFILSGRTTSGDGDAIGNPDPTFLGSVWVIKTDSLGNIQWQQSYGGSGWDSPADIQQTPDGGYLVGAPSSSNDGDVSGNHGADDFWIFKLNSTGSLQWQRCYGGSAPDVLQSVNLTSDNGFLATGMTNSMDGDLTSTNPSIEFWVFKADSVGNLLWQKNLGGSLSEFAKTAIETADGGTLVVGESHSNDGDVSGHHGATGIADVWVVKLSPVTTSVVETESILSKVSVSPNPVTDFTRINFHLNQSDEVIISLCDTQGRLVSLLSQQNRTAGHHEMLLNLEEFQISGGFYLLKLFSSKGGTVKKISYIKQ